MTKHVLVTGGAGFIGSNLVDYFNTRSPDTVITVYDDFSSGRESNLAESRCTVVRDTILDLASLVKAFQGVDSVIHLAAIGSVPRSISAPLLTHDANTTGTLNVLEAARENDIEHVVVASSSSVYGNNPSMPKNELDWTRPLSPYGVSKLATESYALSYGFSYGMKTLAMRFFNVYGPRQRADHVYAAVVPKFIDAALSGEPLVIHGDGLQSRDFTHVASVCAVLYSSCMSFLHHDQPVNLAFGTNTTLLELVDLLEIVIGKKLLRQHEAARSGDVRASQADPNLLKDLFPEVKPVELRLGLEQSLNWFQQVEQSH